MKKNWIWILLLAGVLLGCSRKGVETDYAAAIRVNDQIYYLSAQVLDAEIDESDIIGHTKSYTDTFPKKDFETNFSRTLDLPIAAVEGGIAICYDNVWRFCRPAD